MRKSAEWMCSLDDRVLEHLYDEGWGSPDMIARRVEFEASIARVRERCEWLAAAGFIAPLCGEIWELTGEGERYLRGELNADWLVF